jgi:hypothetical protein
MIWISYDNLVSGWRIMILYLDIIHGFLCALIDETNGCCTHWFVWG